VKKYALNTFVINPLFHIYQKEKIALKVASETDLKGPFTLATFAAISSAIFSFWWM
jgi:hypothetical protein